MEKKYNFKIFSFSFKEIYIIKKSDSQKEIASNKFRETEEKKREKYFIKPI